MERSGTVEPRLIRWGQSPSLAVSLSLSLEMTDILCRGYLEKRASGVLHTWSRRWFVLNPTSLMYYATEAESTASPPHEPKGKVALRDVLLVKSQDDHVIHLHAVFRGGPFILKASNKEDADKWASALCRAVENFGVGQKCAQDDDCRPFAVMWLTHDALRVGFDALEALLHDSRVSWEAVKQSWGEIRRVVSIHSEQEDKGLHPALQRRHPASVAVFKVEHHEHRAQLEMADHLLKGEESTESTVQSLRLLVSQFAEEQRQHILREENTMTTLSQIFSFQESVSLMSSILQIQREEWMKYVLPWTVQRLKMTQATTFLCACRASMGGPDGVDEMGMALRTKLPEDMWTTLCAKIDWLGVYRRV